MNTNNEIELVKDWSPLGMLEITLNSPDDFLKVKETLTRIGISSHKEEKPVIYQSCHILHKQGRYFIVHFKEMFLLDGKETNFSVEDLARRNTIGILLSDWGLVTLVDKSKATPVASMKNITVIPFKEKGNWTLRPKYTIGVVKHNKNK